MDCRQDLFKKYYETKYKIKKMEAEARRMRADNSDFFINNKLYRPIEKLADYVTNGETRDFESVTIYYYEDGFNRLESSYLSGDIFEITKDGHLYYSDYNDGIIEWDYAEKCYYWFCLGNYKKIDIIGFSGLNDFIDTYYAYKWLEKTAPSTEIIGYEIYPDFILFHCFRYGYYTTFEIRGNKEDGFMLNEIGYTPM